jgi:UDP-glucose 4-epimerase
MKTEGWEGRSVLITGGAGFIGSNLAKQLVRIGAQVRVLDDFSTGRRSNLEGISPEVLEGSVADLETCSAACEGVDIVFHEAALPSVARSVRDPIASHAAGATGTLNMLWAAKNAGANRFVYASSSSAYGDTPTLPKHEAMPTSPRSPYAVAKLAGEMYCRAFTEVYGFTAVALRYFNIFGPNQDPHSPYGAVIPIFIQAALDGVSPRIEGDGLQTRDFTYIENAVSANLKAAVAPAERVAGRTFNVGSGDRTSVVSLWSRIKELTGTTVDAIHGEPRPGDVRDSLADVSAGIEAYGYEVLVTLEEGLRRTIEHLRAHTPQTVPGA